MPHISSQTSQISNFLYLPEWLCLLVILFTSSRVKLSLLAVCFIFCFLSWNKAEGNTNNAPCHVTSPCTLASVWPQSNNSWSQWQSLSGWGWQLCQITFIWHSSLSNFFFFLSTKTVAPALCLYWPCLGWRGAVRTIQVSSCPHACRDPPSLADHYIP